MAKNNQIQLFDHFTFGRLIRFTISPVLMMIFTSTYGVVDGFFVSNYAGATAFSALNLSIPFIMLLASIGFMFGTGGVAVGVDFCCMFVTTGLILAKKKKYNY